MGQGAGVSHPPSRRRILFALALAIVASALPGCVRSEVAGIVVHVELERAEKPPPEGHDSWEGVVPSLATGSHYHWVPTGWVVVQRDDGKGNILAKSELDIVDYESRVLVGETLVGDWRVLDVAQP
jgi:hypothetical protein